jgi:translation elongation factor EF-4
MKDKQIKLVLNESELKVVDELIRAVEEATSIRTTRTGLVSSMFKKGVEDFLNRVVLPNPNPTIERTESA